jgi:hypothetical protein
MLITSLFTSPSKDSQARARSAEEAYAMLKTNREDTDYLYHISRRRKYLYVETPKVASTTIKHALHRLERGDRKAPDDPHERETSPLRAPSYSDALFLRALQGDRFFRFCFVRNPFTRILSCYVEKFLQNHHPQWEQQLGLEDSRNFDGAQRKQSRLSFLEFLQAIANPQTPGLNIHWMPQHLLLSIGVVDYDFIGRFENFSSDFARLGKVLGVKQTGKGRAHATQARNLIHRFYGPDEIDCVLSIYENDFNAFLYPKDIRLV